MKKLVFFLVGFMVSFQASAACKIQHLDGEWVMYQVAVDPNPDTTREHTGRCELQIENGAGVVSCDMTINGGISPVGDISDVIVNDDCSVEMTLSFFGGALVSNFDLQLSNNKQSFIGRWMNGAGVMGTTSGLQR